MAERLSDWTRFKLWLKRRKLARDLNKLRRDGQLQHILDKSPYTYLPPGSFMGDDWYHVYRRDKPKQEDFLYSSLHENDVLWWIVERSRSESG